MFLFVDFEQVYVSCVVLAVKVLDERSDKVFKVLFLSFNYFYRFVFQIFVDSVNILCFTLKLF